eukprot:9091371-Pyramimonas_sp.AAC.1
MRGIAPLLSARPTGVDQALPLGGSSHSMLLVIERAKTAAKGEEEEDEEDEGRRTRGWRGTKARTEE